MNTSDILDNQELFHFIRALRSAGYEISTTELMAAQDLLVALAAHGKLPSQLAELRTLLMPVLCHSPKEQEEFNSHFEQWLNQIEGGEPDKTPPPLQLSKWQKVMLMTKSAVHSINRFLIQALVFLILVVLVSSLYIQYWPDDVPQSETLPQLPVGPLSTPTDSPEFTPTIPTESDLTPQDTTEESTKNTQPDPKWLWLWATLLFAILLLFGGWLFWYLRRFPPHAFLARKSSAEYPDITQLSIEKVLQDIDNRLFQSVSLARVAQQLRKHTPIATAQLDIKATIRRTIKAGGWFTPVTGSAKTIPEYLVLIDRTTFKDHHSHLIETLVNRLTAQGVFMVRYYFEGDPRHCFPEKDDLPPVLLTELADRYPTHRLLIFSDGQGFIDPISGEIVSWIVQLSDWTQKAVFTLEVPEQWGYRERLLEQAHLMVMPATETGLNQLAERIQAETWQHDAFRPTEASTESTAFPAYFSDFSEWWLERYPPDRVQVADLLTQVRAFLGDDGYYWFSACAVYPKLQWSITVYLGHQLQLLTEERLAKLARLPWFRYGYMPNWLRQRLVEELPFSQENQIRTVLQALLNDASDNSSETGLEIATSRKFSALKRWLPSWFKKSPTERRDYVFLSFMENRLAVKISKTVKMLIQPNTFSWQLLFSWVYRVTSWCKLFVINLIKTFLRRIAEIIRKTWNGLSKFFGLIAKILKIVKALIYCKRLIFGLLCFRKSFEMNDTSKNKKVQNSPVHSIPDNFGRRLLELISWIVLLSIPILLSFLFYLRSSVSLRPSVFSNLIENLIDLMYRPDTLSASLMVSLLLIIYSVLFLLIVVSFFLSWKPFKKFWLLRPLFYRKLLVNQFIGLSLLGIILIGLRIPIPSLMELEDRVIDGMMLLYEKNIPSIEAGKIPPFVLLDIDNQTHFSWEKPPYTPRDKLKNLIDTAVQAKARLIIVDIDISRTIIIDHPLPDELVLAEYLKNYATQCKQNQSVCSPIILVRTFSSLDSNSNLLTPRVGFFEEVVTQSFPYVQWGSAEFYLKKRWRLWEPTCTKEQQPEVIPSIALLAMGMIRGCTEEIQNTLHSLQPKNCDEFSPPESITFCGLATSTNINRVEQPIMYRLPYREAPENKAMTVHDNQGNTVLTILSAQPYAEESPPPQDSLEAFPDDSVVVIGGSYGSTGFNDMHNTPIGEMPGALVIINAIYSLLQDLTIKPVSNWWLVIAFVIIITLFSLIPDQPINGRDKMVRLSLIILISFIIFGLFVYSFILFEDGTWFNIAVPFALIEICRRIFQLKLLNSLTNKVIGT